jgi:hypothetical protein
MDGFDSIIRCISVSYDFSTTVSGTNGLVGSHRHQDRRRRKNCFAKVIIASISFPHQGGEREILPLAKLLSWCLWARAGRSRCRMPTRIGITGCLIARNGPANRSGDGVSTVAAARVLARPSCRLGLAQPPKRLPSGRAQPCGSGAVPYWMPTMVSYSFWVSAPVRPPLMM